MRDRIGALGALLSTLLLAYQQSQAAAPMPFELAFSRSSEAYDDRPSLSADGRLLAYTVHTPPPKSPAEGRFTATGTPALAVGNAVFVAETKGQRRTPVGPQGANCWRPVFSPDDRQLAFYCDVEGVVNLWVHDLAKAESHRVSPVAIKPMLWEGDAAQWSEDGKTLFVPLATEVSPAPPDALQPKTSDGGAEVIVHRAGGDASSERASSAGDGAVQAHFNRESNAGIGAIDLASGRVRIVVPADTTPMPSVSQLSPTGKWLAYLSVFRTSSAVQSTMFHDIAVVPVSGGLPRVIVSDHSVTTSNYFLDAYAWHPSRDQLFWVQDKKLWTIDLANANSAPRELAAQLTDVTVQPIVVTRDGDAVIVGVKSVDLNDYRNPHPRALAIVPLNGAEPRIVDLPEGLILQSVLRHGRSVAWQPRADSITLQARDQSAQTVVLRIDLRSGKSTTLWQGLAKLQPAGATRDHGAFVAAFEDLNTPVDYYRFAANFGGKERLSDMEPRLAGIRFGTAQTFQTTVPLFDGSVTQVTTSILLPAGAKRGDRLPTVVFLYPGSKVSGAAAEFGGGAPSTIPVSLLTTRGYAVLLAELPIGPDGKAGNPIAEMVDALIPQVYRAADLGYTDIHRVAVSGQSYGGYGAASVLTGTGLFRAGVAIAGIYDLPSHYSWMDKRGMSGARWSETGQGRMGAPPWSDLQRYLNNSPYYRADRIHTPLLMLHGQSDYICQVEDARKMFNALERLGQTVELAEYAGEGHAVTGWSLPNAVDAARRMLEFLDRHMK
ncbi:S9 family peptidase [Peristeroidobacter soli]|uniref:S9 family peptidase n=1 Tax=Peristeroidobacter soli TaxID=2497877 RepID=UPI00101CE827|nr:prolyl oligopeptidase family serine peptidase [Peristeroidobacter soli]